MQNLEWIACQCSKLPQRLALNPRKVDLLRAGDRINHLNSKLNLSRILTQQLRRLLQQPDGW
ncbi:hypothetical protein CCP3SC1AL1_4150003 [Gammaproteobacteria bacterium]